MCSVTCVTTGVMCMYIKAVDTVSLLQNSVNQSVAEAWAPAGRCKGVHGFWLKNFLQRCAIAVIKISAGNEGIKSHNTEV